MTLLAEEAKRRRAMGGGLYFHRLKAEIVATMRQSGALDDVGEQNLFAMGPNVIDQLYPRLDSEVCRQCKTRIFRQCDVALPNGEPRADPQASLTSQYPARVGGAVHSSERGTEG